MIAPRRFGAHALAGPIVALPMSISPSKRVLATVGGEVAMWPHRRPRTEAETRGAFSTGCGDGHATPKWVLRSPLTSGTLR